MIEGIPRISVYIITYNQKDVIHRTLASILSQVDYVYEVCISDDHSTDGTWEILQVYSNKYPSLFKLNRNDVNLGIFENTEKVWTMPMGDIVYDLAGDDSVGEGFFKAVVEFVKEKRIDYKKELFCVYSDYKTVYPNGDSLIVGNKRVLSGIDLVKLSFRGLISNRGACYSANILRNYKKVSKGKSHIAEMAQDIQLPFLCEKQYYIKVIGNVYFARIGVSKSIPDNQKEERLEIMNYAQSFLRNEGYVFDKNDARVPEYNKALQLLESEISFRNIWRCLFFYISCYDKGCSSIYRSLKIIVFAIHRRIPHYTNIHYYID